MPFQQIPEIRVVGINYPVYSFDFEAGFTQGPSSITVNFISKDGKYTPPNLSSNTPMNIIAGENTYDYYPISRSIKNSPSGKTLEVKFIDRSIILDKTFIGLKGRWGEEDEPPLYLVGEPIDICDEELTEDPCNPCLEEDERQLNCEEEKNRRRTEYDYNFGELLNKMSEIGISTVSAPSTIAPDYRQQYTGTLRSVLNSWCADLGLTFFWEDGKVNFLDLRNGISINDEGIDNGNCNILESSEKVSLEGLRAKGAVAYYGKDEEEKNYTCNPRCKKLQLRPMNLNDIISQNALFPYNSYRQLEQCIVLTRLSPQLRDLFVLNYLYGVNGGAPYSRFEDLKGKTLPLMAARVVDVYRNRFGELKGTGDAKIRAINTKIYNELIEQESEKLGLTPKQMKEDGYFFVEIQENSQKKEEYIDLESELATEFIGKFFIRKLTQSFVGVDYVYDTPDGQAFYYDYKSPLNLPFFEFIKSRQYVQEDPEFGFGVDTDFSEDGPFGGEGDANPLTDEEGNVRDTFVLLNRNSTWLPSERDDETLENIQQLLDKYQWTQINNPRNLESYIVERNSLSNENNNQIVVNTNDENLETKIYMIRPIATLQGGRIELSIEDGQDHPDEVDNKNIRVRKCNKKTSFGLRSVKSRKYSIKFYVREKLEQGGYGGEKLQFEIESFTPSQGYVLNNDDVDASGEQFGFGVDTELGFSTPFGGTSTAEHAGYNAIRETIRNDNRKTIPKFEKAIPQLPSPNGNYTSLDISFLDTTSDAASLLSDECLPSEEKICEAMETYLQSQSYALDDPQTEKNYLLCGLPTKSFKIKDGLANLSIRMGSNGVETNITFSNSKPAEVSFDVFASRLKSQIIKGVYKNSRLTQETIDLSSEGISDL